MTTLAQLTDLHLLNAEHRAERGSLRRRLLSYARPLNADDRRARVQRALQAAAGADHLVLTGDLTEDGSTAQYEVLSELLSESSFRPEQITLVPGNHDRYASEHAFEAALAGPLRAYSQSSAPGMAIDVGNLSLIPVDTSFYQHYFFSRGRLLQSHWTQVLTQTRDRLAKGQTVVLAQHHPATRHTLWPLQMLDGNIDHGKISQLLKDSDRAFVIHGHVHAAKKQRLQGRHRIYSASAVVDSDTPLRLYQAIDGELTVIG